MLKKISLDSYIAVHKNLNHMKIKTNVTFAERFASSVSSFNSQWSSRFTKQTLVIETGEVDVSVHASG